MSACPRLAVPVLASLAIVPCTQPAAADKRPARPHQAVIISFDGANDISQWQRSRSLAATTGARFTFFLSCVFLLTRDTRDAYQGPGKRQDGPISASRFRRPMSLPASSRSGWRVRRAMTSPAMDAGISTVRNGTRRTGGANFRLFRPSFATLGESTASPASQRSGGSSRSKRSRGFAHPICRPVLILTRRWPRRGTATMPAACRADRRRLSKIAMWSASPCRKYPRVRTAEKSLRWTTTYTSGTPAASSARARMSNSRSGRSPR